MTDQHPFKWRHYEAEMILLCMRWSLRSALGAGSTKLLCKEPRAEVGVSFHMIICEKLAARM